MILAKPMKWDKMDFTQANAVKAMQSGQGWKVLAAYWLNQREVIIRSVSDPKLQDKREFYGGALHGFNLACEMAEKVIQEALRQKEGHTGQEGIDAQFKGD